VGNVKHAFVCLWSSCGAPRKLCVNVHAERRLTQHLSPSPHFHIPHTYPHTTPHTSHKTTKKCNAHHILHKIIVLIFLLQSGSCVAYLIHGWHIQVNGIWHLILFLLISLPLIFNVTCFIIIVEVQNRILCQKLTQVAWQWYFCSQLCKQGFIPLHLHLPRLPFSHRRCSYILDRMRVLLEYYQL